jgi:adenosylhomocysteinase
MTTRGPADASARRLSGFSKNLIGGCEETTTVCCDERQAKEGSLRFPMIAVNDADTKHLFDNRFGTGHRVGRHHRTTNLLVAGKNVVVAVSGTAEGRFGKGEGLRRAGDRNGGGPC